MRIGVANGVIAAVALMTAWFGVTAPVGAEISKCFRPPEIEAQEAVRYQAKLMVLSDTCGSETYRRFTIRNRAAIVRYQDELIEHFRRTGSPHAERTFDSFITGLANEISLSTGRVPLTSLCNDVAPFLAQADKLDHDHFPQFVSALAAEQKNAYLRCTGEP
jgi:hypothetical protein